MINFNRRLRGWLSAVFFTAAIISLGGAPAVAGSYLDPITVDIKPEERIKVEQPKPVQVLFQFQSNESPNDRARAALKGLVIQTVQNSGLFSVVSEDPVDGSAVLSITIDNIFDKAKAEAKGFKTGLTLGLAGSTVADNYLCTIDYLSGAPNAAKITKTASHAIYTTMGLFTSDPPAGTIKAKNLDDAVLTMTRQIVDKALNTLAGDPVFNPNAPPPVPVAPVPVATATPPSPSLQTPPAATTPAATTPAAQTPPSVPAPTSQPANLP